jgi:type III polyketide synthase
MGECTDIPHTSLKKLLRLTHSNGINTRASTLNLETGFGCQEEIPTIVDLDNWFRKHGVDLTAQACRKALREWGGDAAEDITHTVAFNSGVQSFPGYDFLVARKLGLSYDVENIFLQGVGCAGGLSVMRVAAEVACASTLLKKPARILCFSCELNTPYTRHQYAEAEAATDLENMDIAGSLFSDAAGAFVLCNEYGLHDIDQAKFQLLDWERAVTPDTQLNMGAMIRTTGYSSIITRQVPNLTKKAVPPLFERCLGRYQEKTRQHDLGVYDFDWALHPGGMAIIDSVKEELKLTEEQIRAARQIYRTRGNSGSPTVLCVLDLLRTMGEGKDGVVAVAFGPGLGTEMAFLRRCRGNVATA